MKNSYSLIRGCALMRDHRGDRRNYLLGTLERVAIVTSPFQRSALTQLVLGGDPFVNLPQRESEEIERLIRELDASGFLNRVRSELAPPKRYLNEVDSRDRAAIQLRTRSAPELAQIEWAERKGDGGTSTLTARSHFPIELSGRSRVITLLYSILLASGVTKVRFADRFEKPDVSDLDVGTGPITASDLGLNYYQQLESQRRGLSLFPIALSGSDTGDSYKNDSPPARLVVHYGDCDPEALIEWSQAKRAHLLIHQPIGDEIAIGPLVFPGESPCNRCLSLYEIDNWGFTRFERIPLTPVDDLPMVVAHYVAAIVASEILRFIDGSVNSGGEVLYLNYQRLTSPHLVAISRHPLCGCDS